MSGEDPRAQTQALRQRAQQAMEAGEFAAAVVALDEAVALHRDAGQVGEQARNLHMAATASRLAGDLDGAEARAEAALELVDDQGPVAVSAWTELGETAFAQARNMAAAERLDTAAERAQAAGLLPEHLALLHRRRGQCWAAAGNPTRAAACLAKARTVAEGGGHDDIALRAMIEEAAAWIEAGESAHAEQIIELAGREAGRLEDDAALCDLELHRATLAVQRQDLAAARASVRSARALALSAVHPIGYTAAAVALSELSEQLDDRDTAYEALAVGWATLGDLLGPETAKATFGPKLQALADRWGRDAFVAVRDAYAERRRAAGT